MNKLFIIIIYLMLIQSVKAVDIKEYEIEGMSIGDSLLNHITKEEINNSKSNNQPFDSKYKKIELNNKDLLEIYDSINITYEKDSNQITTIEGLFYFKDKEFFMCHNKRRLIDDYIVQMFPKIKPEYSQSKFLSRDPTGSSYVISTKFELSLNEFILTSCSTYNKKLRQRLNLNDALGVKLMLIKFN